MELNLTHDLAALRRLTPRELCALRRGGFGEQPSTKNRGWLLKRLAWRLQSLAQGDLSQRARQRAAELANDADLRTTAPRTPRADPAPARAATTAPPPRPPADSRLPAPGTVLTRKYKGALLQVRVLPNGFEYNGLAYRSAQRFVARARTGALRATAFSSSKTPSPTKETPDEHQRPSRAARPLPLVRHTPVYTRKSTDEGLEQEFNSLDAQRRSRRSLRPQPGRTGLGGLLPDRYDDGGFTGANKDPPALQRLKADIQAGKIDCVVVYKVDRLSRSLLDFARLMETFEQHTVAFVSVTQLFNTASSMGRLILNVLLSFAQFEREIIAERTRDKIAATRRKGKWAGGRPLLGFDVDPRGGRLLVNADEAERVRAIFALYLEHEAACQMVQELELRPGVGPTSAGGARRASRAAADPSPRRPACTAS